MAINFSNLFRGDDPQADASKATRMDQEVDADFDASKDGLRVESESYSRDEQGGESYDRTSVDTGDTDLASDVDAETDLDQDSDVSASSNGNGSGGNDLAAKGESGTEAEQRSDANADARREGVTIEKESYGRDEDGDFSYDRTSADTGETDASMGLDVDTMADSFTALSSSWDDSSGTD